jgi:hypothetical protein
VTWMMDLEEVHWIVVTWVSRMLALEDGMVLIWWEAPHMTGAQDLFESFIVSDSNMYEELGIGNRQVVQGSGAVVF